MISQEHKFPYRWTLADAKFTKDKGKVFSCFACGGGSTMGYKLAGFDVIGCNEIDPRMNKVYVANHHPRFNFLEGIQTFKLRKDLPKELYQLDILDGSPPCSSFSTVGSREDGWGKKKKFREGQVEQVLDTLFFDFIDLAKELQPKVVIAENVKGLTLGEAKAYMTRIYQEFENAGYHVTHELLNASEMGLPQARERVFFIAIRHDLFQYIPKTDTLFEQIPRIDLRFNEKCIKYEEIADEEGRELASKAVELWNGRREGDKEMAEANNRIFGKNGWFSQSYVYKHKVCPTLTGHEDSLIAFHKPRYLSHNEVRLMSSFPMDYDFGEEKCHYICGMSVPPVMMAQVASRVYEQWLSNIPQTENVKH